MIAMLAEIKRERDTTKIGKESLGLIVLFSLVNPFIQIYALNDCDMAVIMRDVHTYIR
jgi:hypothetical protein